MRNENRRQNVENNKENTDFIFSLLHSSYQSLPHFTTSPQFKLGWDGDSKIKISFLKQTKHHQRQHPIQIIDKNKNKRILTSQLARKAIANCHPKLFGKKKKLIQTKHLKKIRRNQIGMGKDGTDFAQK
ncbi:hypothetical protein E2542_SST27669 [Spatholobus suberectus]|nr:hypothetical protein E2542_SST27669 [Spatholobus suberectus]